MIYLRVLLGILFLLACFGGLHFVITLSMDCTKHIRHKHDDQYEDLVYFKTRLVCIVLCVVVAYACWYGFHAIPEEF